MPHPNPPADDADGPRAEEPLPRLGDFEIIERIGQGAVGAVFKARQRSMDRLVAVKVLKPRLAEDPAYVERFTREAHAAARLSHPNIVLAIDAGEDHGYYYFVMEYVEGHTVGLLRKAAVFEERRALEIVRQVAEALDYAWTAERIVHRDIKPGNIIITPNGTAKLADLGLAQDVLAADAETDEEGAILGTPLYVSPEQIRREADLDIRSDLYALGATLFHMVTGRPPYRGPDARTIVRKHLHEPVPDPREFRPELSDGVAQIILKLLAKDRSERYPDARTLIADIDAVLTTGRLPGRPVPALRRAPRRRSRSPVSSIITLCIVVVAVAVAALALWHLLARRTSPRSTHAGPGATSAIVVEPPSAARAAYEAATAFQAAHPADYVRAIALFQAVEAAHAATTYARLAAQQRERLETLLDQKAEDSLKALTRQAEGLVAAGRYTQALAAFGRFPAGLATQEWQGRVADARHAVEKQARGRFQAALLPGDKAVADGRLEDALKLYQGVPNPPIAAWREELAERIAIVRRRMDERLKQARAEAAAAHVRLMERVAALYRARDYEAAGDLLKAKLPEAGERQAALERELAELGELRAVWEAVERGAGKAIGRAYSVRGIPGRISDVRDGCIIIATASRPFSEKVTNISLDDALAFAAAALDGQQAELAAARLLIAEGRAAAAEQRLAQLEADGVDVSAQRARIEALCRGELRDALRAEFARARQADDPAAALRSFLAKYQDQPAAADLCEQARRLLEPGAAPDAPTAALPARLRLACDGSYRAFLNGKPVGSGDSPEGKFVEHELTVRAGDVLGFEVTSRSAQRGFYALLDVADGRYRIATDPTWRVAEEPGEGWRTEPSPEGAWRHATPAYSPHVKPGYEELGRGLPGFWIWGRGERCCFHRALRLAETAEQQAARERARAEALTRKHGPPQRATLRLACSGGYALTLNGRPVGCAAAAVPRAAFELAVRQGDVVGIRANGGAGGWLDGRLDIDGLSVPIVSDRSWVWSAPSAAGDWDRRGAPAGVWRAAAFLDGGSQRIWGDGPIVRFRKRLDLERLRARGKDASRHVHGKFEALGDRRVEILYDFSDPEQLADWHSTGDLAWRKGRIGGTSEPVLAWPFLARDVEIEVAIEPLVDLIVGLWGGEAGPRRGYVLSVSDSRHATVVLRRNGRTLWMERVATGSAKSRRVQLRRYGRLFVVAIDGRRAFSTRDRSPIDSEGSERAGFIVASRRAIAVKAVRVAGLLDWESMGERRGVRDAGAGREPGQE